MNPEHKIETHVGKVASVDKNYDVFGNAIDASHDRGIDVNENSVLPTEKIIDLAPQVTSGITPEDVSAIDGTSDAKEPKAESTDGERDRPENTQ